jgi:DNA repair protein RadC
MQAQVDIGERIGDLAAATRLFHRDLADLPHEELRCAFLDIGMRLLGVTRATGAEISAVTLPLRRIVREALALDAAALILAHNHPGGTPDPSPADKAATLRLIEVLRPLDIRVIDHLIVAKAQVISFRTLGLL